MSYGIFKPATPTNNGRSGLGIFGPATAPSQSSGRPSFGIFAPATAKGRAGPKPKHKSTSITLTVAGITIQRTSRRR